MTARLVLLALAAALLAPIACARRQSPPPAPRAGDAGGSDAPTLGSPCPPAGCAAGQVCVEWCGFAGCRPGSVFRTCEVPCKTDAQCPAGHACGTVADGPGRVCVATSEPAR